MGERSPRSHKTPDRRSGSCDCLDGVFVIIVAVSYEAKRLGISREIRVKEAQLICPELHIFEKPERYNKPDSSLTRNASWDITVVLRDECKRRKITLEHAPNDQWFLDLTPHLEKYCAIYLEDKNKYDNEQFGRQGFRFDSWAPVIMEDGKRSYEGPGMLNKKLCKIERKLKRNEEDVHFYALAQGGRLLAKLVQLITQETKFTASAGIAVNVLQAKIACDFHKPGVITMMTESGLQRISSQIQIKAIPPMKRNLGDKIVNEFNIRTMDELQNISIEKLLTCFTPEELERIYKIAHGICDRVIQDKLVSNVISCGKNNLRVKTAQELWFHLENLSEEMTDRLAEELSHSNRHSPSFKIGWSFFHRFDKTREKSSREFTLEKIISDITTLCEACYEAINIHPDVDSRLMTISSLKISAMDFETIPGD